MLLENPYCNFTVYNNHIKTFNTLNNKNVFTSIIPEKLLKKKSDKNINDIKLFHKNISIILNTLNSNYLLLFVNRKYINILETYIKNKYIIIILYDILNSKYSNTNFYDLIPLFLLYNFENNPFENIHYINFLF
jgi:hypothetical protein